MPQEIERKFLVKGEYKSQAYSQNRIIQGYISSARGRTVRVRIRGGQGYLTIKGASDASGISRYEWEKEIPLNEAEELMKLCEPGVIDKTRYLIRSRNHVFVEQSTPHAYWLARSFVLLSDVYVAMGKDLDARQYLLSLQQNYQGNDDIESMIEDRLKKLNK